MKITFFGNGDIDVALPLGESALTSYRALVGPEDLRTANAMHFVGWLELTRGGYDAARPLLEAALATRRLRLSPRHHYLAWSLNAMSALCFREGRYARSAEFAREACERAPEVQADREQLVSISFSNLARALTVQEKFAEAVEPLRELHAFRVALHGKEHEASRAALSELREVEAELNPATR